MASTEKIGWRLLIFCCLHYLMCDHNACGSELERLVLSKTPETINRMNDAFPADLDGQSVYNRSVFINQQCQRDLLATIKARDEKDKWAWLALDAAGVVGPGVYEGNGNYLGNYKECQRVKASNKTYEIHVGGKTIQHVHASDGKYCRVYWTETEMWKDYKIQNISVLGSTSLISKGDCVPSSCKEQDIFVIYSSGNNDSGLPVRWVFCDKPLDFNTDQCAIIGLTGLLIFISLVVVATFTQIAVARNNKNHVDEYMTDNSKDVRAAQTGTDMEVDIKPTKPNRVLQVLYCFSLVKNLPALLTTEDTGRTYSSLNGLRFLAFVWIVYGHSCYVIEIYWKENYIISMVENLVETASEFVAKKPFARTADLGVEIFFVLSATLMTLSFLKTLEKGNGKLTWRQLGYHYVHKWIRITPLFMFVIILYACLFRYIASGPQPREFMGDVNCRKNWWVNLLFMQSVFRTEEMCAPWTWYIANDVWYYCISPLPIYLLYRYRKCGNAVLVLWIVGHIALRTTIAAINYSDAIDIFVKVYFFKLYIPPWTRSGEYVMGIFAGYFLFKNKFELNMHKALQVFLWLLSFAAFLLILFAKPHYHSLFRGDIVAWVIAWLVVASCSGQAGWVNAALSWKLFVPLSRLTYAGYLIHPIVIQYHLFFRTRPLYVEDYNMVFLSSGYILITIMLAVPVTLMFEIPFMEMEKLLISKPKPPTVEVCMDSSNLNRSTEAVEDCKKDR